MSVIERFDSNPVRVSNCVNAQSQRISFFYSVNKKRPWRSKVLVAIILSFIHRNVKFVCLWRCSRVFLIYWHHAIFWAEKTFNQPLFWFQSGQKTPKAKFPSKADVSLQLTYNPRSQCGPASVMLPMISNVLAKIKVDIFTFVIIKM